MEVHEEEFIIKSPHFQVGVTLALPFGKKPIPGIVFAGGSMSHLRDGDLVFDYSGPPRKAIKNLAHRLGEKGFASLRYDKPGFGQSTRENNPPNIQDHVDALNTCMNFMKNHSRIMGNRLIIFGESAGAHYTTLLAKQGKEPFAYLLAGALGSSIETLFDYNYGRTVRYAEKHPENIEWVERKAPKALATGLHYQEMFRYAREGKQYYRIVYKNKSWDWYLPPLKEQLEQKILSLFSYLKRPVLIIQGEQDMNVPPKDAEMIEKQIKDYGNDNVTRIMIPNADHNFQITALDEENRFRERISLKCLSSPYSEIFYKEVIAWINNILKKENN